MTLTSVRKDTLMQSFAEYVRQRRLGLNWTQSYLRQKQEYLLQHIADLNLLAKSLFGDW